MMLLRFILSMLFFFVAAPFSAAQTSMEQTSIGDRLSASFGAPLPLLRASISVASDVVTVGDLFDHAGIHAEVPIFRAPAPGTRGRVSASAVLDATHRAGVDRVDLGGLAEVVVERGGRRLTAADLEARVRDALNARLHAQLGEEAGFYEIQTFGSPMARTVGTEMIDNLIVELTVAPTTRAPRFAATIRTPDGRPIVELAGRADHRIAIPVLGRAVGRNDVVRRSDLRMQTIDYARVIGTPTLTDPADIIGQAARRSLRAGAPVSPDDLTAPLMVERQDLVTLTYRHGALALTVRARALDEGSQGQAVDVMNLQSNRVVRGVVAGHGLVHVLGPMQNLAATSSSFQAPERIQ